MFLRRGARTIDLPNETLLPGMIEGHSHLFLHPYNETSWNDQVTNESFALRTARADRACAQNFGSRFHHRARSRNGRRRLCRCRTETGDRFRNYSRPALIVVTRAIVATGSYGPKYASELDIPQGGQEASGVEECIRVARTNRQRR